MFYSQDRRKKGGNKTVLNTNQISPFSFFVMVIGNYGKKKKNNLKWRLLQVPSLHVTCQQPTSWWYVYWRLEQVTKALSSTRHQSLRLLSPVPGEKCRDWSSTETWNSYSGDSTGGSNVVMSPCLVFLGPHFFINKGTKENARCERKFQLALGAWQHV